jgi:SAM-dependent methyltransferase
MTVYALTIFISAFLLFLIQPIVARLILPWFGGAAAVWSACLLFFQVVLLLGYLYAHLVVRRLRPQAQFVMHAAMLGLSVVLLRVAPNPAWKPAGGEDPVFRIVGLLAASVGLPYFLLATTGPLLQAWYARTHHAAFPYRLYALSNLGCLLALLCYPTVVEPFVAASNQARIWTACYIGFCLFCGYSAWRSRKEAPPPQVEAAGQSYVSGASPSPFRYGYWLALAACSSTLLLAVTNYITQNVASVPFLWVVPLSLYLISLILTFDRDRWYRPDLYVGLVALSLSGFCYGLAKFDGSTDLKYVIPLFTGAFFICCMFCHGELARHKPHSRHLTSFYLTIAVGGAIGGIFVGAAAPRLFRGFFELPVGVFACAVLGVVAFRGLFRYLHVGWALLTAVLAFTMWTQERAVVKEALLMKRNFYGSIRVKQDGGLQDPLTTRTLVNGTITHGLQYLAQDRRRLATTYYGPLSGVGLAIENTRRSAQRVGVIGLGAGTLATYGRPEDYYRFYEINPLVIEIARRHFTYLMDCRASYDIVLGDARLSLEREASQQFDVLAVDAFSSDSIPVHLLTLEAFRLYFRHIRPGGVLAVHVSNSHLELEPVVERISKALGRPNFMVDTEDGEDLVYGATWVLLSDDPALFRKPAISQAGGPVPPRRGQQVWTDDYSNLVRILK